MKKLTVLFLLMLGGFYWVEAQCSMQPNYYHVSYTADRGLEEGSTLKSYDCSNGFSVSHYVVEYHDFVTDWFDPESQFVTDNKSTSARYARVWVYFYPSGRRYYDISQAGCVTSTVPTSITSVVN